MRIINFGSLNIDDVFKVGHIAEPGETVAGSDYQVYAGGKGNNQSIAVARAGGKAVHFGKIGRDGLWLIEALKKDGVQTDSILCSQGATGRALIQVDGKGQNAIVLFGGANHEITENEIKAAMDTCREGDRVLVQNEISHVPCVIKQAKKKGLKVCFNSAPIKEEICTYPLAMVDLFIINEIEGQALSGHGSKEAILNAMLRKYPAADVLLTLGKDGAVYANHGEQFEVKGLSVKAVDTTGAGDTFIGYFLTGLQEGLSIPQCLELANRAAALCVTRRGAVPSIPYRRELNQ